jgi:hypothetical protein
MNANSDLDWVQAPPQAFYHDKKQRRKNSNHHKGYGSKKYNNGHDDYYSKASTKASSRYSKKSKPSRYSKQSGKNTSNYKSKKISYSEYMDSKSFKCYNKFDSLSTDVSETFSPDRVSKRSCQNFKVTVLGDVVVDKINPKFKRYQNRNRRFAAACELKAPEPTEIALPTMF